MRISCKVATLRQIRPSNLKIFNIYSSAVISLVKIEKLVLEEATMKLFFSPGFAFHHCNFERGEHFQESEPFNFWFCQDYPFPLLPLSRTVGVDSNLTRSAIEAQNSSLHLITHTPRCRPGLGVLFAIHCLAHPHVRFFLWSHLLWTALACQKIHPSVSILFLTLIQFYTSIVTRRLITHFPVWPRCIIDYAR